MKTITLDDEQIALVMEALEGKGDVAGIDKPWLLQALTDLRNLASFVGEIPWDRFNDEMDMNVPDDAIRAVERHEYSAMGSSRLATVIRKLS